MPPPPSTHRSLSRSTHPKRQRNSVGGTQSAPVFIHFRRATGVPLASGTQIIWKEELGPMAADVVRDPEEKFLLHGGSITKPGLGTAPLAPFPDCGKELSDSPDGPESVARNNRVVNSPVAGRPDFRKSELRLGRRLRRGERPPRGRWGSGWRLVG